MIANPAYRVRVPHEPHRFLAATGESCPMTVECVRLINDDDVDTEPPPKPEPKAKAKAKAKKTKAKKG